jgi:chromosomal replication initiator protein
VEINVSANSSSGDVQLVRLQEAIAQRVGPQRFRVWFENSTRLVLRQESLDILVPNDFISEWITRHFTRVIQDSARQVLGCQLDLRFAVAPDQFHGDGHGDGKHPVNGRDSNGRPQALPGPRGSSTRPPPPGVREGPGAVDVGRLRHSLDNFVVGPSNHMAHTAAMCVADLPGKQYNPLFLHGACGLGKTHLLQGICRRFAQAHPERNWAYLTGEEFTTGFVQALRHNRVDQFRRQMRQMDLLVIDDVHFLAGKEATLDEFLHTFNAIEAMGHQIVLASDNHPKLIQAFGESLINRFVSGMVVRLDPPNLATRCEILRRLAARHEVSLPADLIEWIARRVTQNVRELEGAVTRVSAYVKFSGAPAELPLVQEALADLDRQISTPVRPDNILQAVCQYFGLEPRDLLSGRRQRTISLARGLAMHLIRRTAKLSYPEIGMKLGKRNHSTVISACRRMERAVQRGTRLVWSSAVGERSEEAGELVQRIEELSRCLNAGRGE